MNDFCTENDIEIIKELLGLSIDDFADNLGISPSTLIRWCRSSDDISNSHLNKLYDFAFSSNIKLNRIKEQLFREEAQAENRTVLFHGAKTAITGNISAEKSRGTNDFGKGFYCGENLEQSAMFVSAYPNSSLYIVEFNSDNLKSEKFFVDRTWMLTIAYFRGRLEEYKNSHIITEIINKVENADYIIAPIADNRMFEIIDSFINGEITDIQCQHCLSATNLGNQYVFRTEKALSQLEIKQHCFLCDKEKQFYLNEKLEEAKTGNDKVKIARKQYRGQGKYIEEILE